MVLKGCIKPASADPPTAPKQSCSQSSSQSRRLLNTEQRRQELPLNLKHTIILPLSLSLSLLLTQRQAHMHSHTHMQLTTLTETAHTYTGILVPEHQRHQTCNHVFALSRKNGPSVSSSGHQPITLFRTHFNDSHELHFDSLFRLGQHLVFEKPFLSLLF